MTVDRMIEILESMPRDAEILVHANNHTTSPYDTSSIRVAEAVFDYTETRVVMIGNFNPSLFDGRERHPRIDGVIKRGK